MIKHKDIEYSNNDLIELLKLKNSNISNIQSASYHIFNEIIVMDGYEFTISVVHGEKDYNFRIDFIIILEEDLLVYNRNRRIHKMLK